MTAAQRQAIYGGSANAPQRTSTASQAHAEAKQREQAREKLHQDALNFDTVAIDLIQQGSGSKQASSLQPPANDEIASADDVSSGSAASTPRLEQPAAEQRKSDPAAKADPWARIPSIALRANFTAYSRERSSRV